MRGEEPSAGVPSPRILRPSLLVNPNKARMRMWSRFSKLLIFTKVRRHRNISGWAGSAGRQAVDPSGPGTASVIALTRARRPRSCRTNEGRCSKVGRNLSGHRHDLARSERRIVAGQEQGCVGDLTPALGQPRRACRVDLSLGSRGRQEAGARNLDRLIRPSLPWAGF